MPNLLPDLFQRQLVSDRLFQQRLSILLVLKTSDRLSLGIFNLSLL
ncbi:MAG: hypothetical protein VKK04_22310 [Synechococcales bacterium]|nr:hypothetical protein [Synechococcales bacterium]